MLGSVVLLLALPVGARAFDGAQAAQGFDRAAEANGWVRSGQASPLEEVELSFWLKQTNLDELKRLADAVSDPKSPDYGKYLSKDEVDALTAPAERDESTVMVALKPYEGKKDGTGAVISAVVPVEFATKLFGGTYERYCTDQYGPEECLLRNPTASVPKALATACDIIAPLDDPLPRRLPGPIVSPKLLESRGGRATPAALAEAAATGCCFRIGYGAMMRPCCLETRAAFEESDCHRGQWLGGATGFREGACPASADQAARWLTENGGAAREQAAAVGEASGEDPEGSPLGSSAALPCAAVLLVGALATGAFVACQRRTGGRVPLLANIE